MNNEYTLRSTIIQKFSDSIKSESVRVLQIPRFYTRKKRAFGTSEIVIDK